MIKYNFIIALRNILRQKGYSFLNITGLAVGLSCAFFITIWILDELQFDRFHEKRDRIYRVMRRVYSEENVQTRDRVTWNIANTLKEEYPEVEKVAVSSTPIDIVVQQDNMPIREQGIYATSDFFDMFSWNLIIGEKSSLLNDPTSIVISHTFAEKHFGPRWRQKAIGAMVKHNLQGVGNFNVTGVYEDIPRRSSLHFDFVLSMELFKSLNKDWLFDWNNSGIQIFVLLNKYAEGKILSDKIKDIQNKHVTTFRSDLFLQKYTDQHLYSSFRNGVQTGGQIENIKIFIAVAIMIIIIACINFMNLSTARSMRRSKEIGIRKASGAARISLIWQFMGESLILVFLAFLLAIILVVGLLPVFRNLTGKDVTIFGIENGTVWFFFCIGILTAFISGIYPALYLSSFNAVKILRGTFSIKGGNENIRKVLVIFQFLMSTLLIIGTITMFRQMQYINTKNLGLDKEHVIYMPYEGQLKDHYNAIKDELLRYPLIKGISTASENPMDIRSNTHQVMWKGKDPDNQISMRIFSVNFDFLKVMKMELIRGRDFDPHYGTDSVNYIINEKAQNVMGLDDPIGERLSLWGTSGTIVGVVKDFQMTSMNSEIEPTIILLRPQWTNFLFLRIAPGQTKEALTRIEDVCSRTNPNYPFEYHFLNDTFERMYRSEMVSGKLVGWFTAIAIFISCLGLFGLASYVAERRNKEIGIRKVMGATIPNIISLLNKDFLKLVITGFLIAIPIAWFLMNKWLENFAYKIDMGLFVYIEAGIFIIFLAMVTVSWRSVRSALMNSAQSLRSE